MPFRFVHTADIHLDSPLRSLALRDPDIAGMIGSATRQAFERTVDLCLEERVDALIEERVTSIAQFERVAVDVTGLSDWTDVLRAVEVALGNARDAAVSDHLIARIEIAGTTPLVSRLRRDDDLLLEEARQAAASLPRTAIEKVSVDASPPVVPGGASDYDPVEELRGLIEGEVLASEEFRSEVRNIVGDLQRQLPPELRDVLSDGEDANSEMVARIVREGGEHVLARLGDTEDES